MYGYQKLKNSEKKTIMVRFLCFFLFASLIIVISVIEISIEKALEEPRSLEENGYWTDIM